jgi:transcriptional antiterminator NusG
VDVQSFPQQREDAIDPPAAGEPWFAIWTRSRHEATVKGQLSIKGIESFLPTVPRWSRWKDRRKRVDWPLFPGYCFARLSPVGWSTVRTCSGVVSVVSVDGRPSAIPDAEIEALQVLMSSGVQCDPCPFVMEGDLVEVVWGPLRGVVGRLVRKGSNARLVLSVNLVAQAVSVEVDAADVRPY